MKVAPLLPLMLWILSGCAPDAGGSSAALRLPRAGSQRSASTEGVAKSPLSDSPAASYEVSIASAQADHVQARDQCDSQPQAERKSCRKTADDDYDQAKSVADSADLRAP